MVERADKCLIARIEQVGHEAIERAAGVNDWLAAHAVADVEQHAHADGRPLVGELRDGLLVAVLEDLEVVLRQAGDQPVVVVGDGDRDFNGGDAASERLQRLCLRRYHEGR